MAKVVIRKDKQLADIDFSDYEVEEAVETILDVIVFPVYIAKSIAIPMFSFLGGFILLSYYLTNHFYTGFLLFILCFVTSVPTQIFSSVIVLLNSIRRDAIEIFSITLRTAQKVYFDSKTIHSNSKSGESRKNTVVDITGSLFHSVIKPSLKHTIKFRLPFLGTIITGIIGAVFKRVLKKNAQEINQIEEDTAHPEDEARVELGAVNKFASAVDTAFMVVMTPILLVFLPILTVTGLLIFLYIEITI
jgi:hypothetical protein